MTNINEVYKCNVCGNIVEVLHSGAGELVCCNEPMNLLNEKTEDDGKEKHTPVLEKIEKGIRIVIGSEPHPMEDSHHIEWIEINTTDNKSGKKFLSPGQEPSADFYTDVAIISARAYCNVHGLWKAVF